MTKQDASALHPGISTAMFKTTVVDPQGNALSNADVKGAKISYRDVHDRILAVTEYNNGQKITTTYDYDAIGQIKTVKDAKGNL
ncbi:MAG: hypothetical protein AABZ10_12150, partial [Nitrospirota bacterium]